MPPWLTDIQDAVGPYWTFILGGVALVGGGGKCIKWFYDTRKAQADAKDRAQKALDSQQLVKKPTLQELKEACEEFDAYERLRVEHLQRITKANERFDNGELEDLPKLSPLAETLSHNKELLQAAHALESLKPNPARLAALIGMLCALVGAAAAVFRVFATDERFDWISSLALGYVVIAGLWLVLPKRD